MVKKFFKFINSQQGGLGEKVARSAMWVTLASFSLNFLSIIKSVVLARLLTPEIFGLMGICMMVIRGAQIITETGFGAALIHRQHDISEARDVAYTLTVIRGFVLGIATYLVAPVIAQFYENPVLEPVVQLLAIALIVGGFMNINTILCQKELNFKSLFYLDQSKAVLDFLIVVVLAYFLRNIWALAIAHVATSIIFVFMSFILISGKPKFNLNRTIIMELFHYGKYVTGITIVIFVTTEIDNALIGKMLGVEVLGYYVVAYMLANLPATHIAKLISSVMFPAYSKLQNDREKLQKAFIHTLKTVGVLIIPSSIGLVVVADHLIAVVFGEKWIPAVEPLKALALFGVLRGLGSVNGYLFNAVGKPNINFYLNSIKLLSIVVSIYPLILYFGVIGAAIAITAPAFILYFVEVYFLCRTIQLSSISIFSALMRPILTSVAMGGVIYLLSNNLFADQTVVSLLSLIVTGIVVYAALNYQQIRVIVGWLRNLRKTS